MKDFLQVTIRCPSEVREILIAELDLLGFDALLESEEELTGAIPDGKIPEEDLKVLLESYNHQNQLTYVISRIQDKNWNEIWEKNYQPVVIENKFRIRASFHQPVSDYPYQITIDPKMTFGTGHHDTTYLMIQAMLELWLSGKSVLDAGCGTGILAIAASRLGAGRITAIDVDESAVANASENIILNDALNIRCRYGTVPDLNLKEHFNIILANINKNVLHAEIPFYSSLLYENGNLVVSGFLLIDIPFLVNIARENKLDLSHEFIRNEWACLVFEKKTA